MSEKYCHRNNNYDTEPMGSADHVHKKDWFLNPYWTGRTYMSLSGKGLEGHICPTIVTSWWHHCGVI